MTQPNQPNMNRQVTVEVTEGNPVILPYHDVDKTLMDKLFPNKYKRQLPFPVEGKIAYKQRCQENAPIDRNLMHVLGLNFSDEDVLTATSSSPSPPVEPRAVTIKRRVNRGLTMEQVDIGEEINLRDALNHLQRCNVESRSEPLRRLQREALEAQIAKDLVMAKYYAKKLELLQRND